MDCLNAALSLRRGIATMEFPEPPTRKLCRQCQRVRAQVHFAKDRSSRDGFQRICLDCSVITMRQWRHVRIQQRQVEIARRARSAAADAAHTTLDRLR